jgi:hypothetical protein
VPAPVVAGENAKLANFEAVLDVQETRLRHGRVASRRAALPAFPTGPLRTGLEPFSSSGSPTELFQRPLVIPAICDVRVTFWT